MKRNCSLDEISDGKLYDFGDLVKVNCNGCNGNATCCHGMGNSIVLDPFDIYRLETNLNTTFEELLLEKIELNIVDGIILPNLKMIAESESCAFLNKEGRCSIHTTRPGICRIFPLGRYYENHDFKYFLQTDECKNKARIKTKVTKWIDTPNYKNNKQFLLDWHYFLNDVEAIIKNSQEENLIKKLNMYILNEFYIKAYDRNIDFYHQFQERMSKAKDYIVS